MVEVGLQTFKLPNCRLTARPKYAFTALKITNQKPVYRGTEVTQIFPNFVRTRCKLDRALGRKHLRVGVTDTRDKLKRWTNV